MLDRIRQIMELKNLTASQFADGMDVPRAVLSHILSGRNKPSLDVILKIASSYTDVSLEWLLLEKGDMLNSLAGEKTERTATMNVYTSEIDTDSASSSQVDKPEEIQKDDKQGWPHLQEKDAGKVVRQVMFFYTDGTFESFKPDA